MDSDIFGSLIHILIPSWPGRRYRGARGRHGDTQMLGPELSDELPEVPGRPRKLGKNSGKSAMEGIGFPSTQLFDTYMKTFWGNERNPLV